MKKTINLGILFFFITSTVSLNAYNLKKIQEEEKKTRAQCFRESLINYVNLTNQEVDEETAFIVTFFELNDCINSID